MKPPTTDFLNRLENARLFDAVGQPISDQNIIPVTSWLSALRNCASAKWSDAQLEMHNEIGDRVQAVDRKIFNTWNDVVETVRPPLFQLLKKKIGCSTLKRLLFRTFTDSIRWDLMHCCIEKEFLEICQPGYSTKLGEIYLNGHFPCGWDGDYPKGKLKVF